jgi:hypothetical protein
VSPLTLSQELTLTDPMVGGLAAIAAGYAYCLERTIRQSQPEYYTRAGARLHGGTVKALMRRHLVRFSEPRSTVAIRRSEVVLTATGWNKLAMAYGFTARDWAWPVAAVTVLQGDSVGR